MVKSRKSFTWFVLFVCFSHCMFSFCMLICRNHVLPLRYNGRSSIWNQGYTQGLLDGNSIKGSQWSLHNIPEPTIDQSGLSNVRQNLSNTLSQLHQNITSHITRSQPVPQHQGTETNSKLLSPNSLRSQLLLMICMHKTNTMRKYWIDKKGSLLKRS